MKNNEEKINNILLKKGFEILSERAWKRLAFSWLAFVPFTLNEPILFFIEAVFSKNILPQKQFSIFICLSNDYNKSTVILSLKDYLKLTEEEIVVCFLKNKLGTNKQAKMFFKLMHKADKEFLSGDMEFDKKVKQIHYKNIIEKIERYWKLDNDTAKMIVSVLVRHYGVNFQDYDDKNTIALPSAIKTVFMLGLIKQETPKALQTKTRKLFPLFPEIYDYAIGDIASNFCYKMNEPFCEKCYMNKVCPKIF
ncbi:MAG: hypothetical protein RL708_1362 [Bacteroidota bacterium]